jgi:DNA-binding NtrC family response regulator
MIGAEENMRTPPRILIVDDEPINLDIFQTRLSVHGYEILTATDGEEALAIAKAQQPDLILLDILMPKMDGIDVCRHLKADTSLPFMPIVMVTAKADSKDVVAGLEAGADEYLTKPVDQAALAARVKSMLRIKALHDTVQEQAVRLEAQSEQLAEWNQTLEQRVQEQLAENTRLIQELQAARERLQEENLYLRQKEGQVVRFDTLVGQSPQMQEVYRLIEPVLHTTATVLITGESGTGKERIAQLIHSEGPHANGPFIAINCAAIPETLLEAELFGYEKGAFTGATQRKPGRFELADGGTLFLDEVGEMSPVLQAKLLRVLQERQFERVGGTETIATDAQFIAATNQDLDKLVREGRFRQDLLYRLNVYPIPLPPLRERHEDLLPLALRFLGKYSREFGKEVGGLSRQAHELIVGYDWPGSVRELENIMERAVILCRGSMVTPQELPLSLQNEQKRQPLGGEALRLPQGGIVLDEIEKQLILQALEQAHHNKVQAGKLLGLSRTQLRTRMKNYGLDTE